MEIIELNNDFHKRACVHAAKIKWQSSPMKGVERRMLDRIGDEVARATTIVRYAPGSNFSPHVHTGGEEFFVLDGVFQDEQGDFPKGSYIRNPPQSSHTPGSKEGCTILVKLWQMHEADRTHIRIDTNKMLENHIVGRDDARIMPLFNDGYEDVRLERWDAEQALNLTPKGGLEIFVLEGGFDEGGETFEEHSWLRLPVGQALEATAGAKGAVVWIKEGHLAHLDREAFATL